MPEENSPQTPITPPVRPVSNNSLIGILVLLILILLAATGFLAYQNMQLQKQIKSQVTTYSSPVPSGTNETANWNLVETKIWSFKIPPQWDYFSCKGSDVVFVVPKNGSNSFGAKDHVTECNFDGMGLVTIGRSKDHREPLTSTAPDQNGFYTTVLNKKEITIAGKKAVEQEEDVYGGQGEGKYITVYVQNTNQTDTITLSDLNQKQTFDQFLSTFKFTDQSQTDTSSWKTYTGTNFSFKYPTNWQNLTDGQGLDIALGFSIGNSPAAVYLTVSTTKSIDLSSLKRCDGSGNFPCINGSTTNLTLGGKSAIKASVAYGITDSDFEIVQTTQNPFIQFKMNVSGGGLSNTFDQILSTMKFTQ